MIAKRGGSKRSNGMTFGEFMKRVLAVFAILLLVTAIWAARATLLLGFAAALIAVGLSIPARWLQRLGLPRYVAIITSVVVVNLAAVALLLVIVPTLARDSVNLLTSTPAAATYVVDTYTDLRDSNSFLEAALPAPPAADTAAAEFDPTRARAALNQLVSASLAVMPGFFGGLGTFASVIFNFFFVLLIAIFFLIDPKSYVKISVLLFPQPYHTRIVTIWNELYHTIKLWLTALFSAISVTVVLVWLILGVLLGMPNAIVVAVFAGVATLIPTVGVLLPLIPITIFTLASANPAQIFVMIPAYLVIQIVESNLITPSIVRAGLKIPVGGLLVFQLLITIAFGALGLLLTVPLLATLIVLIREIYSYDLLSLRSISIELSTNAKGDLSLSESTIVAAGIENEGSAPSCPNSALA
ncbi:MAG: AI-2E family transporter [Caldilinea sp.]